MDAGPGGAGLTAIEGAAWRIRTEGMSPGVKRIGLTLLGVALALASYGIWLIVTEDLQGGRDLAGSIFLAAAAVAALLGSVAIRGASRR